MHKPVPRYPTADEDPTQQLLHAFSDLNRGKIFKDAIDLIFKAGCLEDVALLDWESQIIQRRIGQLAKNAPHELLNQDQLNREITSLLLEPNNYDFSTETLESVTRFVALFEVFRAQLRKLIIQEPSPHKRMSYFLDYPRHICPILKTQSLRDSWVQESLEVHGRLIASRRVPIEQRELLKKTASHILNSILPSLQGKVRLEKPDDLVILSRFEYELGRLSDLKPRSKYRNPAVRKLEIRKLYRELPSIPTLKLPQTKPYDFVTEQLLDKWKDASKRKIATHVLAYQFDCEPTVARDWIAKARKNSKKLTDLYQRTAS